MKTSSRNILLSAGALLATAAALCCIELGLRLFDRSLDNPLVTVASADSSTWYRINRSYLRKYFPPNVPLLPELKPTLFAKEKKKHSLRVVCLGGSSMFGVPYQMTCTLPAMAGKELRRLYPGYEFEVINLGASAINSNVIVDLAREIIPYQPDLVLLYAGHNEFYGPDGVGASFLQSRFPSTIQWVYRLRELRLFRLLQNLLAPGKRDSTAPRNLMKQVSQGSSVPLRSGEAERIFSLFERNLKAIIATFRSDGIPVVIGDVASNLDFPPFASDPLPGGANPDLLRGEIEGKIAAGEYRSAEEELSGDLRKDSANAFLNYWLGKVLLAGGEPARAKPFLVTARDNDLLKFRAPSGINRIIRRVAGEEHVPLVGVDSLFAASSPSGIAGKELFWEHLHPTPYGYYLIASAYVGKVAASGLIDRHNDPLAGARLLPFDSDSLSLSWFELAYGDLSMMHLTTQWPFSGYAAAAPAYDSASIGLRQIVQEAYNRKIPWEEGCYRTAHYFWKQGNLRAARTTYEALIEDNPENYYAEYLLGNLLVQGGEREEATGHLERSIGLNARYLPPRVDLGLLRINEGRFDEAIVQLSAARGLAGPQTPAGTSANISYGLSAAYANKGDYARALQYADEALKLAPGYADASRLRADILRRMPPGR